MFRWNHVDLGAKTQLDNLDPDQNSQKISIIIELRTKDHS